VRDSSEGLNLPLTPDLGVLSRLPQAKELEYAASHLTSIEINVTFYGSQKPESFRKWAATMPDGFVFSHPLQRDQRARGSNAESV
jgi:hypothetical protein